MRPDPSGIIEIANAFYSSAVLFAATDAGVFSAIGDESCSVSDVAKRTGSDERATRLLLDACKAMGLLAGPGEEYRNTECSKAFLTETSAASLVSALRYNRDVWSAWGKLPEFLRTGLPVEKPELHLGEDPERTRSFVLSMHGKALGIGRAALAGLDLNGRKRLLDVGGGPGTYSVLISQAWPGIECTILDLPEVIRVAEELIEQAGVSGRVRTLAGDYRQTPFPDGLDVVLFFGMLHQESPESILNLFRRAYRSLNPGGVVYVVDLMTDSGRAYPPFSALFAVNMALTTENGWVFSDAELETWFQEAGFGSICLRPLPPPMPHWMASAVKPGTLA